MRLALAGEQLDRRAADLLAPAAMKSAPFSASRAAAVASTWTRPAFMPSAERAEAAERGERLATDSSASRLVSATERPSAQSTFSLKIGVGARAQALIDDETDRVRADVDDRDRRAIGQPAGRKPAHLRARTSWADTAASSAWPGP